jgi:DNA mismatch repair protein MutL
MLSHALRSAYQGFLIPGYQPIAYLFFDLPAGDVDVNVHPTKTEVRFRDSSDVYRLAHHAVREALESRSAPEERMAAATSDLADPRSRVEAAVLDFLGSPPASERERAPFGAASPRASREAPSIAVEAARETRGTQVLDSFILIEELDGLTLIDQHALHEKILFEEIHGRLGRGEAESQRLLVPEVVDLPAALMPLIEDANESLRPLGFEVERFGPGAAAIRAFPALFDRGPGRVDLPAMVRAVLEGLRDEAGESRARGPVEARIYRIAATIACKRAVKAGTRLAPHEIGFLLAKAELARDPRHCPHGRPAFAYFSRRAIEKEFDRK